MLASVYYDAFLFQIAVVASVSAVVAISGVVLGLIFRPKKPKRTLVDSDTKIPLRVVDRSVGYLFLSPIN